MCFYLNEMYSRSMWIDRNWCKKSFIKLFPINDAFLSICVYILLNNEKKTLIYWNSPVPKDPLTFQNQIPNINPQNE